MDTEYNPANPHGGLQKSAGVRYRPAGLLDVPLIFDLLQEGALNGAFSDKFVLRTGPVLLWRYVVLRVLARYRPRRKAHQADWRVIEDDAGTELGFMSVVWDHARPDVVELQLLAIKPELRNQGWGRRILGDLHAQLPPGKALLVHTTRYARAMQHLLKDLRFRRNPHVVLAHIEEYQSNLAPLR